MVITNPDWKGRRVIIGSIFGASLGAFIAAGALSEIFGPDTDYD